jgi:hypothetical protein
MNVTALSPIASKAKIDRGRNLIHSCRTGEASWLNRGSKPALGMLLGQRHLALDRAAPVFPSVGLIETRKRKHARI